MVARALAVSWEAIRTALEGFQGVGRRFQRLGEARGIVVIDDYAHHPTEITATLAAARARFPGRRLVAVFQPHLFSRTRDQAQELGRALAEADEVWVTEVYPAREKPIEGVSGVLVAQAALDAGAEHVFFHPGLGDLPGELVGGLKPGDVCITLGAGSVEVIGGDLLVSLGKRREEEEV
jgi:UDP-N-acetylmuramate--alanine ligase